MPAGRAGAGPATSCGTHLGCGREYRGETGLRSHHGTDALVPGGGVRPRLAAHAGAARQTASRRPASPCLKDGEDRVRERGTNSSHGCEQFKQGEKVMTTNKLPGSDAARHGSGDADLTIMLAAHEAFRRDLVGLARAASFADLADPARRESVGN